ncbi:MAG: SEC-C metal-binding domain-containing protein [Thermoleophilia bacterium]
MSDTGRNDPCPCGSGRKYKKCCLASVEQSDYTWRKMCRTEDGLISALLQHADRRYGKHAMREAWDEFSLWEDVPMDPGTQMELEAAFIPWFVYNWIPDNAEKEKRDHLPEIQIALSYLAENKAVEPFAQRLIQEACSRQFSFFMVSELQPGRSLTLRDMFLKRDTLVLERTASASLHRGDIIFAHVVTLDGTSIMTGCAPVVIPAGYANEFIDFREKVEGEMSIFGEDILYEYDTELRDLYYRIKEELYHPAPPRLSNTDGHVMEPTKLFYSLGCSPAEAFDALKSLSSIPEAELLEDASMNEAGRLQSIEFPWLRKNNRENWDNTILGTISIDGDKLVIDVNSRERAESIKRKVTRRLGGRATFRNAVIESAEKILEEAMKNQHRAAGLPPGVAPSDELMDSAEMQSELKAIFEPRWKEWLDISVPALNGQTPREAAGTPLGRERLEALLLDFERSPVAPGMAGPDVAALRRSLGMESYECGE